MPATVFSDVVCQLGEGPSYDTDDDQLWWFDITARKLLCKPVEAEGTTQIHSLPFMASAIARIDARTQLIAAENGLYRRDKEDGSLTLIRPLEDDNPVTRSNDGRVHPAGALWIGTMGKQAEKGAGAIYWFRDGELRRLFGAITIPNAICFAPDGGTAYFTDTADNRLMRVATDPATGLPSGEPSVLHDHRGATGGLDGAICDADGLIWNACWGAAELNAYSPMGDLVKRVDMPCLQPTCPALVGIDGSRLAVTSATQAMEDDQLAAYRQSGMTFLLDFTVAGRREPDVKAG